MIVFATTRGHGLRRVLAAAVMVAVLTAVAAPAALDQHWRRPSPLRTAPDPLLADLDLDREPEIIQCSGAGLIMALDAETGRVRWKQALDPNYRLLSPVAGHFQGTGRISVLVPTTAGRLYVLDGPTGRLQSKDPLITTGFPLERAPTVLPLPQSDDPDDFANLHEAFLLHDGENRLIAYRLTAELAYEIPFQVPTQGRLAGPPVVGQLGLSAPPPHVAFVTRDGVLTVLSALVPETSAVSTRLPLTGSGKIELGVSLGDLNGDGMDEAVIADSNGYLFALTVRGDRWEPVWPDAATAPSAPGRRFILRPPRYAPILIDANGDGADDILIPREREFALIDGRSGSWLWQIDGQPVVYGHPGPIPAPPAAFTDGSGTPWAVFCDDLSVWMLNLKTREAAASLNLNRGVSVTPLILPFGDPPHAACYVRTQADGIGRLIGLGVPWGGAAQPWAGSRGGPTRAAGPARYYTQFQRRLNEALTRQFETLLQQARRAADEQRWSEALELTRRVLGASPQHREALRLRNRYYLRKNVMWLAPTLLGTLAVGGWAGRQGWRLGRAQVEEWLARRALRDGRQERAAALLWRLCRRFPHRRRYVGRLADLLIQQKQFTAQTAPVFEQACRLFPNQERYLKALATAYSSIPRHDAVAAAVYREMARLSSRPGPWYFILGQTLLQIDRPREALDAFRQAVLDQFDDPRLPHYLADLYIRLDLTSPDILPTLDRVRDQRLEDRAFLRIYCQACQEARRYDETAQQMAERLLALDPAAPSAHIILATRLLQAGLTKEALRHAQDVLQVNPNDPAGLRLLGACYAAERRLDETAMRIFARALEANPDAPELLIAVSHGLAQAQRLDPEACDIYRRALVHHPNDETILYQLARVADRENDDELTIRAVEPLLAMGRTSRELILQLANAYCRLGIVEDKAEAVYQEALAHQPDHAGIQENLAAIYLRKGRCDAEAGQVFEAVFARHPERFDLGLQLARCYIAADLPEKALDLGRRLLEHHPDDDELRKLIASASDKANQMESAIAGYEQVLARNPHDAEALCALSSLYGRRRRSDNAAIEIYNQAIQLQPHVIDHYLAAARAYADRDSWDHVIQTIKNLLTRAPDRIGAAIALMESLVDASPRSLPLRWYLVDSLIFDGRLRDARRHLLHILRQEPRQAEQALLAFDRILEKNPKDALAHLERGRILAGLGREREARLALEQAHRYHPDNEEIIRVLMGLYQKILEERDSPEIRFQLGRLAMRIDKYDLAISCFQQTSRDYRWEAESVRHLARCFMARGMLDLALQQLRRLPMESDVKELLYELGQRYEAAQDVRGAREVYKLIFAADIAFKDVKGKLETLVEADADPFHAERTAIVNSLSDEARRRYELIQELGRGAMGIVYKAHDKELDEIVALKLLPDNLIRNPEAVRRFKQEARNARRLSHPNIVRIHDIGEEMGRKYISMEFIHGTDLKQKLRKQRGPLPYPQVLAYARQICEAMAYAHAIGIVHRDIKPANLMLTADDQIKVSDFGIAKMIESTQSPDATMQGAIIGTPLYMSPEQVKGQPVDHRADIYSMGVVFYELLTGRPPFTEGDLSYQHLFVEPKPLPPSVPPGFAAIVMKCLAKNKEDRWQSVQEMLQAILALPEANHPS